MLEGFKASLFGLSTHFESQIAHPARRGGLMQRAHEALDDAWSQARLATDRLDVLLEGRAAGGLLHRVGEALHAVGRPVGL